MTLSEPKLLAVLEKQFVCGWRNIQGKEAYAGKSHDHPVASTALQTSNGSGGRNVQMLFIAPSGMVLHCLPGYWDPDGMMHEIEFILELAKLEASDLPLLEKRDQFQLSHLNHAANHSEQMVADSYLQGFDKMREEKQEGSDFRRKTDGDVRRTVDQVMHERMARRPFIPIERFDIGTVVDYGTRFYDKGGDGCCDLDKGKPTAPKRMKPPAGGVKKYGGWKKSS
ncbi:MAG: hypothetical protein DSY81_10725 [Bacillota bacterium]|nr:MAG: hypothetical protein DSY92_01085 [Planctomycetota bacterium]RUA07958.1 MAG: hypothetical protein DSY81_10725 [Bacillota bacterium]